MYFCKIVNRTLSIANLKRMEAGNIVFKTSLDNGQLNRAAADSEKRLRDLASGAEDAGASIDNAMKRSADQMRKTLEAIDNNLRNNEQELESLRNQYVTLGKEAGEAFRSGNDEGYRLRMRQQEAIQRDIALLNQEQRELRGERESIEKNITALEKQQKAQGKNSEQQQSLIRQIRELRNQMAQLAAAGQKGSEEYAALAERAGTLQDAYADTTKAVQGMASDTARLDAVLSLASAGTGGFSALTGAMQLFGAESEDMEKAQAKLQAAIALATGMQQIQMAVQKESAVMLGIQRIQTAALARAQALSTRNTIAATVAQKVFNQVAKANPYVLLAIALASVVGALAAFTLGNEKATASQRRLNEIESVHIDQLQRIAEERNRHSNETIKDYENELKVAQARNASSAELQKIEEKIHRERASQNARNRGFYAQEIQDLEENRAKASELSAELERLNTLKAQGEKRVRIDLDLDGKVERVKIDEAIDILQSRVDNYGRKVEVATQLVDEEKELEAERKAQAARWRQSALQAAKTQTEILRSESDLRLGLLRDEYAREVEIRKAQTTRAIEDIRTRLKTENDLTKASRESLNRQIELLDQVLKKDLQQMEYQHQSQLLAMRREAEDEQLELMKEGSDKQREELRLRYMRQYEDAQRRLNEEPNLGAEEAERLRGQMIFLQQRYAQESQRLELDLQLSRLETEKETLELRLELQRRGSAEELALRQQQIENEREQALVRNRQLSEELRQSEDEINAVFDARRATLLTQASQEYKSLFDELSGMTKARTAETIQRIQSIVDYVKGVNANPPGDVSQEFLDQLKASPEALRELYERLNELQKSFNQESGYPFASIVEGIKRVQEADRKFGVTTRQQRDELRKTNEEYNRSLLAGEEVMIQSGGEVAQVFGEIGSRLEALGASIQDSRLQGLGQELSAISSLGNAVAQGAAAGGWIGAVVAGALNLVEQLADGYAQLREQEYQAEVRAMSFANALRLLDLQLKDTYDNAFGERTFMRIADAAVVAQRALSAYNEALGELNALYSEEVNPLQGTDWAQIDNLLDAVGKLSNLGAVQVKTKDRSGIANFLGFEDEFTSLADLAPELFNEDGSVKVDYIKTFLDTYGEFLDEKTRQMLENVLSLKEAYEEATESVRNFVQSTFGYLGNEAVDALVDAIENGGNAWETFRKKGSKAIESLGEQLVYELFLASHFEDFQKQLERIYGIGEYASENEREYYQGMSPEEKADEVMEAQDDFFAQMESAMEAGQAFMEAYKERADRFGWDLWDRESPTSLSGSVKNITEESASVIAGHLNAMRIMSSEANRILQNQLYYLADISRNTAYLQSMDTRLRSIESNISGGNYVRRLG